MNFEITPEQQQLVDSVRAVLEREVSTALVRGIVENQSSPEQPWKSGCELGWTAIDRGFAKFAKGNISPEHSLLKLFGSEISQRAGHLAIEAQGVDALDFELPRLVHPESSESMPWMKRYFQTYAATISAGASEIQRNIIAQRVLGLPRG